MSLQVEKMEKNMAKLTIEVSAEDVEKAMQSAYQKAKGRISIPGFRKGKAPRKMIEQMYGKGVFLEDAVNALIPEHYSKALGECELEIVSQPKIDLVQTEPGKALIFTAEVAVKPEVTLGEYKGVEVPKSEIEVTDEEVDAEVKKEQEKNSRTINVEDRAAQLNDIVTIDFEGSVDGVPFDGGQATEYPLTLGSNTFIPGFEDQLVGLSKGDSTDVEVTFPEDYFVKDLAGKEAIFKVNIQDVKRKELPELNDEYVASKTDFKTVEELRANYKERMQKAAEANAKAEYEHELIDLAVANAKFSVPEIMIEDKISQMVEEMKMSLESRKMSLDMYMQYTGLDMAKIRENQRPVAEENVKTDLVLDAIAKAEDIQVDMADVDAEIAAISAQHGASPEEVKKIIKGNGTMGLLLANILRRKAAHVVIDSAK